MTPPPLFSHHVVIILDLVVFYQRRGRVRRHPHRSSFDIKSFVFFLLLRVLGLCFFFQLHINSISYGLIPSAYLSARSKQFSYRIRDVACAARTAMITFC